MPHTTKLLMFIVPPVILDILIIHYTMYHRAETPNWLKLNLAIVSCKKCQTHTRDQMKVSCFHVIYE